MVLAFISVIAGLFILLWSADKFVEGSSAAAKYAGMSPLLIGMLIVGFGTSAPEFVVSVSASLQGNPSVAIGNAFGSNIANIALILGITAMISPIRVNSRILKKELPVLTLVTIITLFFIIDLNISRFEGIFLILIFICLMIWGVIQDKKKEQDSFNQEMEEELLKNNPPLSKALIFLVGGLILLIISSRVLVWGALYIAKEFGVSDLMAGLTIVAIGTSLPELASSLAAVKQKKHEIALGNVIGSNLFNTLAVTGTAFLIHPSSISNEVLSRDFPVMLFLTFMIFVTGFSLKKHGIINRFEGGLLTLAYVFYLGTLIYPLLK